MAALSCMIPGKNLDNVKEDFRSAVKIEQYRFGKEALYVPEGLRWKYLPYTAIEKAEESFRVISAGHCVPVREKRPEIDLSTEIGTVHIQLEKQDSLRKVMGFLKPSGSAD